MEAPRAGDDAALLHPNGMTRLAFAFWQEGETFWACYVTAGQRPVHENWAGLWDVSALRSIDYAHWKELAVNGNNGEEVAVYLRVVWQLLGARLFLGNARHVARDASLLLQQSGTHIQWEFDVDAHRAPGGIAINGFQPARAAGTTTPPVFAREAELFAESLLFDIRTFRELSLLTQSVLRRESAQITFYGVSVGETDHLTALLRTTQRPAVAHVLQHADTIVALGVGVDDGYNDFILIASTEPLEPRLVPIVSAAETAIAR